MFGQRVSFDRGCYWDLKYMKSVMRQDGESMS
jgi:hypothetical protein